MKIWKLATAAPGTPVCNLSDEATVRAFTSGDSDIAVAQGMAPTSHALGLTFRPVNDWPSARYQLLAVQDWSSASALSVMMCNDSPTTATIEIFKFGKLVSTASQGLSETGDTWDVFEFTIGGSGVMSVSDNPGRVRRGVTMAAPKAQQE